MTWFVTPVPFGLNSPQATATAWRNIDLYHSEWIMLFDVFSFFILKSFPCSCEVFILLRLGWSDPQRQFSRRRRLAISAALNETTRSAEIFPSHARYQSQSNLSLSLRLSPSLLIVCSLILVPLSRHRLLLIIWLFRSPLFLSLIIQQSSEAFSFICTFIQ